MSNNRICRADFTRSLDCVCNADCGLELDTSSQRFSTSLCNLRSNGNRRIDSEMLSSESTTPSDRVVESDSESKDSTENSYKTARTTGISEDSSSTGSSLAYLRSQTPNFVNKARNVRFEASPELDLTLPVVKDSNLTTNKNIFLEDVSSQVDRSSSGINNCARHCNTPEDTSNSSGDGTIKMKDNICKFIQDESMPEWAPSLFANSTVYTLQYSEDNDLAKIHRTDTILQSQEVMHRTRYKTLLCDAEVNNIYRKTPLNIFKSTCKDNHTLVLPDSHISLNSTRDFEKLEEYVKGLPSSPINGSKNLQRSISTSDISIHLREKLIPANCKLQRAQTNNVSRKILCSTRYKTPQHNPTVNSICCKTVLNTVESTCGKNQALGSPNLHVSLDSTENFERLEKYVKIMLSSPANHSKNLCRSVSTSDISTLSSDKLKINCTLNDPNSVAFDTFDSHCGWIVRNCQQPMSIGKDRDTSIQTNIKEQEINEDELSASLLIEWRKKRQRCFDTAMKMQEIVLESESANKDSSRVSDLYMDPSNEFIKTITTSVEYQNCLASVRQNINFNQTENSSLESSSDNESKLSETYLPSVGETSDNAPSVLRDRKQNSHSIIHPSKSTSHKVKTSGMTHLFPSMQNTSLISHNKDKITKIPTYQMQSSPVSAKTTKGWRRKFFVTPGKPVQQNSNDKKRIFFPNVENEVKKDLSHRIMKSLHAPGLYRLGYQTVISPVSMYIHGTDMNLIQNRHEKKNEMLLTPCKATTSEDKLKFKLSGKTSTPHSTPPKNSRFAYKKISGLHLDANNGNIRDSDFALPKTTYRLPAQVRTVNEDATYNRGARTRGLLQSTQNRLVIRHEGKEFEKTDDNQPPKISSDSADMSIHVQKSAKKTNYMSHWK